jgi:hypothetical protein
MSHRHIAALIPVVALVVVAAGGCGGECKGPTCNGVPPIITLTPATDFLLVGETLQLSGTVSSGGTATGTWGSDNTNVATVDNTGKVTAVSAGKATVFLDAQGARGTRLLTVYPSYRGSWNGYFTISGCTHSGDFSTVDFCADSVGNGDTIVLQITQNRTTLTGTIDLGGFPGSFSGSVREDGSMALDAVVTFSESGMTFFLTVRNWAVRSESAGLMAGDFSLVWTAPGVTGSAEWSCRLSGMSRTSGGVTSLTPGRGARGAIRAKAASIRRR